MLYYKEGQDSILLMCLRGQVRIDVSCISDQSVYITFSKPVEMLLSTRMSQTHTHIHTYRQTLSSLALQTGEDAAQVSLDRAIK